MDGGGRSGRWGWLWEIEEDGDDDDGIEGTLLEELEIDPVDIMRKLKLVLFPFRLDPDVVLGAPDFWGPFFVVMTYAFLILWGQLKVVSWVLTMWLMGSYMIYLLGRVFGTSITYSQSVGVIGYSALPLLIVTIVLLILPGISGLSFLLKGLATIWAAYAAGSMLMIEIPGSKRVLMAYPLWLLYVYIMSLSANA